MLAAIYSWWDWMAVPDVEQGGDPAPPPDLPVLMDDLLTNRLGEPEFLIRWREAQARKDAQP